MILLLVIEDGSVHSDIDAQHLEQQAVGVLVLFKLRKELRVVGDDLYHWVRCHTSFLSLDLDRRSTERLTSEVLL